MVPRLGIRPLVGFAVVASGLTNIAVGLAANIEAVLFLRLLSGAAMAGFVPLSLQWLASLSHGGAQGRMAGLSTTAMMAGNVLGWVLGSWIAVEISLEATFWLPGILLAVAGVVFLGARPAPGAEHAVGGVEKTRVRHSRFGPTPSQVGAAYPHRTSHACAGLSSSRKR